MSQPQEFNQTTQQEQQPQSSPNKQEPNLNQKKPVTNILQLKSTQQTQKKPSSNPFKTKLQETTENSVPPTSTEQQKPEIPSETKPVEQEQKDLSVLLNLEQKISEINLSLTSGVSDLKLILKGGIAVIEQLCVNKSEVKIIIQKGSRECVICEKYKQEEGEEKKEEEIQIKDKKQVLHCPDKKCQQFYHFQCIVNEFSKIFSEKESRINKVNQIEEVTSIQDEKYQLDCLSCQNEIQPSLSLALQKDISKRVVSLRDFCKVKIEQLKQNIGEKKLKTSSCELCKHPWLLEKHRRQIHEADISDESLYEQNFVRADCKGKCCNEYMDQNQTIQPLNDTNAPVRKTLCIQPCCGQAFCRECLSSALIKWYLSQYEFELPCPNCSKIIPFSHAYKVLSQHFTWFQKYRNERFLVQPIQDLGEGILEFHRCPGLHILDDNFCEETKIADQNLIRAAIHRLETEEGIDLTNITNIPLKPTETIFQCHRIYLFVRDPDFSLQEFFEELINGEIEAFESEERGKFYQQVITSGIIEYQTAESQNFQINCWQPHCGYTFCLNGCLDLHDGNPCPSIGNENHTTLIPVKRIFKDHGETMLWATENDDDTSLVIHQINCVCMRCYSQLKPLDTEEVKNKKRFKTTDFQPCTCYTKFPELQ